MRLFFSGILFFFVWNIRPAVAQDKYALTQNGYIDRAPNLSTERFLGSIRFRVLIGALSYRRFGWVIFQIHFAWGAGEL